MSLPTQARAVVIGGGIVGCSTAYHLGKLGWKDTVLVTKEAELLVRFDQPASRGKPFMFHCHVLEHEDLGMMGQYVTT